MFVSRRRPRAAAKRALIAPFPAHERLLSTTSTKNSAYKPYVPFQEPPGAGKNTNHSQQKRRLQTPCSFSGASSGSRWSPNNTKARVARASRGSRQQARTIIYALARPLRGLAGRFELGTYRSHRFLELIIGRIFGQHSAYLVAISSEGQPRGIEV